MGTVLCPNQKSVAKERAFEGGFDWKVYYQRVRLMNALRMLDHAGDNKKLQGDALKGMSLPARVKKLILKGWLLQRKERAACSQ